jgi:hypothetical protein
VDDEQVDREDEEFAHVSNASTPAILRKTARHESIFGHTANSPPTRHQETGMHFTQIWNLSRKAVGAWVDDYASSMRSTS